MFLHSEENAESDIIPEAALSAAPFLKDPDVDVP